MCGARRLGVERLFTEKKTAAARHMQEYLEGEDTWDIHHFEEKCLSTSLTLTNFHLLTLGERFSIFYNTKPHIFMKFIVVIRESSK